MLVRTFRLTDKLSNAFLRLFIWMSDVLVAQVYRLRLSFVSSLEALIFAVAQTIRSGRIVYQSSEERRREIMARRAAEAALRPTIREDPLKTQNRALSMFTVVLMASLLMLVLWFTGNGQQTSGSPPRVAGGPLPLQTKAPPTPFPTIIPTPTPLPNPLNPGGSIVFSVRERGRDNLWVFGVGQGAPIRLTNTPADDHDPSWSPDGTRIAFSSHRDGNWELYVMEVATGNISRLTYDLGYENAPTWSPDGKFIAYEGYEDNSLGVYVIPSDGSGNPIRLTSNPAPNYSPAWSPDGRRIAYVSLRDGNQEIYIADLRPTLNEEAVRLTRTPTTDEEAPTWSPDGQMIAYDARVNGLDMVFVKPVSQPDAEPLVIGQGREPTWAPNGASVVFAVDNGPDTTLIAGQVGNYGVAALAITVHGRVKHPNWSGAALLPSLIQSGGVNAAGAPPLYSEAIHYQQQTPPYYRLAQLSGVNAPYPYLSDKVDDSFMALRQTVVQQIGFDFLGTLKEAAWSIERGSEHLPEPGQSRLNWHYAGRSFDVDRNLIFGDPPPIDLAREDIGVNTYWRMYVRVPDELQGGQLGEPLKVLPWDFASRTSGDPEAFENGGKYKTAVPSGYYVDFTQLAEDYGWTRIPSDRTWRSNFPGILYWEYDRRDNLSWNDAMLELYTQEQINLFLSGPAQVPTPIPLPTETPGPTRTPTPIPPDVK
jgi:TolB protein